VAGPRYVQSGALPLTAAGANSGRLSLVTPDDNLDRKLTGVFITDFTVLIHTQLFNGQAVIADIQHVVGTLRVDFIPLNETVRAGQPFQFVVFNDSGGAVPASKFLQLRYETP
jgi:hypothetical protein